MIDNLHKVRADDGTAYIVLGQNCSKRPQPIFPAHVLHSQRRLRCASSVRKLETNDANIARLVLAVLITVQLTIAYACTRATVAILLAVFVGAFLHFGMQEMMHQIVHRSVCTVDHFLFAIADVMFGLSGPPFYIYYTQLHLKHHQSVGEVSDPDAEFQKLWMKLPKRIHIFFLRWCWTFVIGGCTKLLLAAAYYDNPRAFVLFSEFSVFNLCAYVFASLSLIVVYPWRAAGLLYIACSAAFSMGAGAHPCLLFWIMQHAYGPHTDMQHTVSYGGSAIIHFLHFGALFHAEHHDMPKIPFFRMHLIPADSDRKRVKSAPAFILDWLRGAHVPVECAGQTEYTKQTASLRCFD
eukprot:gnl/TRDRNA2_/TRDRNA2_158189_c0_seq2.p1 gnl/TRDRNA2_/TRDRNA2_158189_c0~~gnl/TRDRNA2_/TRDRNA2_158189_c0_seq2.p1  ORF type:complete len:352 (-),score=16.68 gnl/TRDRNA2_/TRDRNA2_158189_c0_seq2:109-1164(-)